MPGAIAPWWIPPIADRTRAYEHASMRSSARVACLALLGVLASGCASSLQDVQASTNREMSRSTLNGYKRGCMKRDAGTDCYSLGTALMHGDAWSKRHSWTEPMDRKTARAAFLQGCNDGDGRCCAALVEYKLASPDERQAATRRAAFLYSPVQSPDAFKAQQQKYAQQAAAADAKQAAIDAKAEAEAKAEDARENRTSHSGWLGGVGRAFEFAHDSIATVQTASNTHLSAVSRAWGAAKHANDAARDLTGRPLVGENGLLLQVCSSCSAAAQSIKRTCHGLYSDPCLHAIDSLGDCFKAHQDCRHSNAKK